MKRTKDLFMELIQIEDWMWWEHRKNPITMWTEEPNNERQQEVREMLLNGTYHYNMKRKVR